MRRPREGPAAIDGYASADAVARGPTSVLFRLRGVRGRDLALKVFQLGANPDGRARPRTWMLDDWRTWSELAHPHVLPVVDLGERSDSLYVATPWVDGPSLRDVLDQRRTIEPAQIRELAGQLAGALDAAAAVGLVHLDIKPENVLFEPGGELHAYVRDFGAGSFAARKAGADRSHPFRGTFEYAAPEQIDGGAVDGRATVYSLGCLLYETLTAATPYAGRSRAEAPPPVPAGWGEIDRVFARALAKRRDERYATCTELAEALSEALALAPAPRPASGARRRRFLGLRQLTAAAAVALVLSAAATAASWVTAGGPRESGRASDRPPTSRQFFASIQNGEQKVARAPTAAHRTPDAKRVPARKAVKPKAEQPAARLDAAARTTTAAIVPAPLPHHVAVAAAPRSSTPAETTTIAPASAALPPPPPPPASPDTTPSTPLPPPPP